MKSLHLQLTLRSPALLAGSAPADSLLETLQFIPGNNVRGILAERYLGSRGTADSIFHQIFVSGRARFGFAFAEGSQVIPLSARSCKYDGGFQNDGDHGMLDLLLPADQPVSCRHPKCGLAIDSCRGFWDPSKHRRVQVKTRTITRAAIDARRGSSRPGRHYLQRVLEEGQKFSCSIEVPDNLETHLDSLCTRAFWASLGRGVSRGQGWVEVEKRQVSGPEWGPAKDRFKLFSEARGKPVLAVTLLTDGLFKDNYLRDVTAPTLEDLTRLQIVPSEWKETFVRAFMDVRAVFGFDGEPVYLPRVPRLAVTAGSVFLFEARDDVVEPTIPEGNGVGWIGDLNREGYGLAALWHPFHLMPEGNLS